ncbi:hypothetical protein BJ170DRAFT_593551 [Xylariales sp. AK1849]|nr:hypothetical protein BJ170DRAFT_593551 [Xylariales sp. AK1849]
MRTLTKVLLFVIVLGISKLNTYSKLPEHSPAESHVLRTITYGLGGGMLINTLCGMTAPQIDAEISPNDGFMSCAPFGLAGTLVVARMYIFATGGWGREQWVYANQLVGWSGEQGEWGKETKEVSKEPEGKVGSGDEL